MMLLVRPKLPQPAALLTSLQRLLPPVVLLRLPLLVAQLTSRKKSPLPAVLPVALATSNRLFPPKTVPGGKNLTGNLVYYSVLPIYDRNNKCKVTTT